MGVPRGTSSTSSPENRAPRCMARVPAAGGEVECVDTPVPCSRLSPDGALLSCGNAEHQGVLDLQSGSYRQLVTLAEGPELDSQPPRNQGRGFPAAKHALQPGRREADDRTQGRERRSRDWWRSSSTAFVTAPFRWLADDLHHPTWRPRQHGDPVLSATTPGPTCSGLAEADIGTGRTHKAFDAEHVPAGAPVIPSRLKPHLVVTDCLRRQDGERARADQSSRTGR